MSEERPAFPAETAAKGANGNASGKELDRAADSALGNAANDPADLAANAPASGATDRKSVQDKAGKAAALRPPLRAVFMGTPEFAATIMRELAKSGHLTLVAAYTQPDRPAGRGKKLTPPPVKVLAESLGIPVLQPLNFKNTPEGDAATQHLASLAPDVLIVAAYGLILPQRVLDIPRLMPINVHASLLPKYRGAAPIQRAIMAADHVTGVTIMRMEAGLDTGPMLMQRAVGIGLDDSSATLHEELAREGADLLLLALERLRAGALASIPQDDARASHAAKLTKEESRLNLSLPPLRLHAAIRGLTPWPGAVLHLEREGEDPLPVQILPGVFPLSEKMNTLCAEKAETTTSGDILGQTENTLLIRTHEGCYAVKQLKPAGKQIMDAASFANGYLKNAKNPRFT